MLRALRKVAWISSLWLIVCLGDLVLCDLAFTPTTSFFNRIYLAVLVLASAMTLVSSAVGALLLHRSLRMDFDHAFFWLGLLSLQFVLVSVTWAQRLSPRRLSSWPDGAVVLLAAALAAALFWLLSRWGTEPPGFSRALMWLLFLQSSVAVAALITKDWSLGARALFLAVLAYGMPTALLRLPQVSLLAPALTTATAAFVLASHFFVKPEVVPRAAVETPRTVARPNVVLIVLDTVRSRSLSVYGYERHTMPRLEAWSRREDVVTFRHAFSDANWTLPSHGSLFTGLYAPRHGAKWSENTVQGSFDYDALHEEHDTLAELLAGAGYRTSAVVANNGAAARETGLAQGFEIYDDRAPFEAYTPLVQLLTRDVRLVVKDFGERVLLPYRDAREITDTVLAYHLTEENPRSAPFFLFVNYLDAHVPYNAPNRDRFDGLSADFVAGASGLPSSILDDAGRVSDPTPAMETHLRALYDAELHHLDGQLGRIFDWLDSRPEIDAQTLVIVTSDHGESLVERDFAGHGSSLFNPEVAIPMFVKFPREFRHRTSIDPERIAQLADLHPTVLDVAGLSIPDGLDGIPLHQHREAALIAGQFVIPGTRGGKSRITREFELAVVVPPFKYYAPRHGKGLLFDVRSDPDERKNIATEVPDVAAALRALAEEYRKSSGPHSSVSHAEPTTPGEDQLERLRALGYLQ